MAVMTLQGFSSADWERSANTTLTNYISEVEQAILRQYAFGALLESKGRIVYNSTGRGISWPLQWRLHSVTGNAGTMPRNFTPTNLWKWANLDKRGYQVTDAITYREMKENEGPQGLIKVWNGFTDRLQQSLRQQLGPEYYVDGSDAANPTSWHGLESMFATNGTVSSSDGSQRTANAADFVGYPNDTYANLSTALGAYGGANESGQVWPKGIADAEYDFYSPLIVNTTCTGFSPATHTWAGQGDQALRFGLIHAQRNTNQVGQVSQVFLDRTMYFEFLNLYSTKEQIQVMRNANDNGLVSLGFRNTVLFDGVEVTYENAIPAGVGYGVPLDGVELHSIDSNLFRVEGPEYDIRQQSFIAAVSTISNLKFKSPRNFIKWKAMA